MEFKSSGKLIFLAWLFASALVLYYVILEVYLYIAALIVLYAVYKFLAKQNVKKIEIKGQGVFITGCDTGFGHEIALRLEKIGFTVFAGCLVPEGEGAKALGEKGGERLHVVPLDVTKDESVAQALETVKNEMPKSGIYAVINNAGIELIGDIEIVRIETMKCVAEVNYYGIVRVTQAFLPLIRKSKGRVINVTSVKGRIAVPTDVAYISAKWAGEAFSDILRREMYRFGVKVVIIEPGHFGGVTDIVRNDNMEKIEVDLNEAWDTASPEIRATYGREYIDTMINGLHDIGKGSASTMEPVIDAMQDAVENVNPKYRYLVHGGPRPLDWYCVCAIMNQLLPEAIVDYFLRLTSPLPYAKQQIR